MAPFDAHGEIWGTWEETTTLYPEGLSIVIDGDEFATLGMAQEERVEGTRSIRRWVAIAPVHENGRRVPARWVDEQGVKGLKQRADRERLYTQRQEQK